MRIGFLVMIVLLTACKSEETENVNHNAEQHEKGNTTTIETENTTVEEGLYQEFHPDGSLKIEGKLNDNGEREGLWISYYENGTKWSESYYVNGKRDGHTVTFYPNGKVRYVGEYKNDEKTGEWKFYDESGQQTNTENF